MRTFVGLAALALVAGVNAQGTGVENPTIQSSGAQTGNMATFPPVGATALSSIAITVFDNNNQVVSQGSSLAKNWVLTGPTINAGDVNSNNWVIEGPNQITYVQFVFVSNQYTGQMQYRWSPAYTDIPTLYPGNSFSGQTYTCDQCTAPSGQPGTPVTCNTAVGPGGDVKVPVLTTKQTGFPCAGITRTYRFGPLRSSTPKDSQVINSFSYQLFDVQTSPAPNVSSYSFIILRDQPIVIHGDPQIVGMQGQDFQVHGIPDEIFNMVTYPTLQVNARFTYLDSAECLDNFTQCFAHPGTYISEEGFRIGKDKVRVTAGSHKKGLTVTVNGKKLTKGSVDLKLGAVEVVNHRRVVVHTNVMKVTMSNSDKFLNQELEMNDDKLISLGAKRRTLKDGERFHSEVPLHGLQGQTWRNVEYPSGLDYEGSITDYHVVDGNLFGTDFVFNQFQA